MSLIPQQRFVQVGGDAGVSESGLYLILDHYVSII